MCAAVILANKCDLASEEELNTTLNACRILNEKAAIISTTFGNATLWDMLPARTTASVTPSDPHAISEEHEFMLNGLNCGGCGNAVRKALMAVDGVTDVLAQTKTDTGGHPNKVVVKGSCDEMAVREAIAALDADRGKYAIVDQGEGTEDYTELRCSPARANVPNSADELGFRTHVYHARRPFNSERLGELFALWPVPTKKLTLATGKQAEVVVAPGVDTTFTGVLRSKGTVWLDTEHLVAAAWSHAGRQFQFFNGGVWWATLPEPVMQQCLPEPNAFAAERSLFEGDHGDRRQEIVFIGTNLDVSRIDAALGECLCTDDEMREYSTSWAEEEARLARPFRFDVGTRVECNRDNITWSGGTVVAHHYRESNWPPERWMPYQVELDDGTLICAPMDDNICVREE